MGTVDFEPADLDYDDLDMLKLCVAYMLGSSKYEEPLEECEGLIGAHSAEEYYALYCKLKGLG